MTIDEVRAAVGAALATTLSPRPEARVHGGSINECYRWETAAGPIFVKVAAAGAIAMLEAEAAGLAELSRTGAVRVPRVLGVGTRDLPWLALEWVIFHGSAAAADAILGRQLAVLHRVTADSFGWDRDNTIGSTRQHNERSRDWIEFFRERRLRFQLDLAAASGYGGRLGSSGSVLLEHIEDLFGNFRPVPSLLHGDLWSGNRGSDERGRPVLFDPAVYYGDRVADLAMTRLFGGFAPEFQAAYEAEWPLEDGAQRRVPLYNLYHVLNHLNLFGAGYLARAESMIEGLLEDLGYGPPRQ